MSGLPEVAWKAREILAYNARVGIGVKAAVYEIAIVKAAVCEIANLKAAVYVITKGRDGRDRRWSEEFRKHLFYEFSVAVYLSYSDIDQYNFCVWIQTSAW